MVIFHSYVKLPEGILTRIEQANHRRFADFRPAVA
jgi:hypothetical protein